MPVMKRVILMRHAKSSWSDPQLDDHDRPLSKRGRKSAPVMAKWLAKQGPLPDRILCSTSQRTRETVRRMRKAVRALPEPELCEGLYFAEPETILRHLQNLPQDCQCALVIGHQPDMGLALRLLDPTASAPALRRAYGHYPTAAIAVLEADVADWREIGADKARFIAFAAPRELMD
jgi:phosphohistidine phosphatase